MNKRQTTLTLALTAAVGAAGIAYANGSPFALSALSEGYQVAQTQKAQDGKGGEAKSGGDKQEPKAKDGKCGEGKCGAAKPKAGTQEGKSGDRK